MEYSSIKIFAKLQSISLACRNEDAEHKPSIILEIFCEIYVRLMNSQNGYTFSIVS